MTPANVASWWLQSGAMLAVALLLPRLLRMRHWRSELALLQIVLLVSLALPLLQRWKREAPVQRAAPGPILYVSATPPAGKAPQSGWMERWTIPLIAAGVAVRLLWLAAGLVRLRQYRLASRPWQGGAEQTAGGAPVRICKAISGPATFGWLHPVVLLPPHTLNLPPAELRTVLLHEQIHVRRADWPAALAEEIIAALLWCQPLVWAVVSRIRLVREKAVDAAVVAESGQREPYIQALMAMAAAPPQPEFHPAPPMLRRRNRLPARIHSLIHEVTMSRSRLLVSHAFMATALAAVGIMMVSQYPLSAAPSPQHPDLDVVFKAAVPYPAAAKARRIEGTVTVELQVNEDGEVVDAHVITGPQELRKAALQSVLLWRYNNKAKAPLTTTVDITFTLGDSAAAAAAATPEAQQPAFEPTPGVQRIRVGGNRQSEKLAHKVSPLYPPLARQARLQGTVRLNVLIAADGTLRAMQLVSGHPLLVESAQEAVKQWRWNTTLLNGVPAEVLTVVDVNYTLLP